MPNMINFEKIHHFSYLYDFYNRYLRFFHNRIYYKKIEIVGKENIPKKGVPTLVISNHQNGLMDALAILYLFNDRRQPVFIARGDIFRKQWVAKLLRFLKIMPTFRSRDGGRKDIEKNNSTFSIAATILKEGGTVAIFPEAGHQAGHFLSTFKKGFARVAFQGEEAINFSQHLQILPLNIHYSNYFNFRNELLIEVGQPFTLDELSELYKKEHNSAILQLMDKARNRIKEMVLDIEDSDFYSQLDLLRTMFHIPLKVLKKKDKNYFYIQLQEDIHIIKTLKELKERDNANYEHLMQITQQYQENLKKLNLRNWVINNPKIKFSSLLTQFFFLLIFFPFFLFGWIHNIIPFTLPNLLKRKIKDPMLHSSVNFAVGVLLSFPIIYVSIFVLCLILSSHLFFSIAYILAVFLSLFLFYDYKKRAIKWFSSCRYYNLLRKKDKMVELTQQLQQEIMSYKKRKLE